MKGEGGEGEEGGREGGRGAGEQAANVKIVCGEIRKQARETESKEIEGGNGTETLTYNTFLLCFMLCV